jgi:hypothetical protein
VPLPTRIVVGVIVPPLIATNKLPEESVFNLVFLNVDDVDDPVRTAPAVTRLPLASVRILNVDGVPESAYNTITANHPIAIKLAKSFFISNS